MCKALFSEIGVSQEVGLFSCEQSYPSQSERSPKTMSIRMLRSICKLRISKHKILDSRFLGISLWILEVHPVISRICLSQTLWNPDSCFVNWPQCVKGGRNTVGNLIDICWLKKSIRALDLLVYAWHTEGYGFIEFEISNSTHRAPQGNPKRGIRPSSHLRITFKPLLSHWQVTFFPGPPFRIPLWRTVRYYFNSIPPASQCDSPME